MEITKQMASSKLHMNRGAHKELLSVQFRAVLVSCAVAFALVVYGCNIYITVVAAIIKNTCSLTYQGIFRLAGFETG